MKQHYTKYGNYDLYPEKEIKGYDAFEGYEQILGELEKKALSEKTVIVCDFYPGINKKEVMENLLGLKPSCVIDMDDCMHEEAILNSRFKDFMTEDRVFGVMTSKKLQDCFDPAKIAMARDAIERQTKGIILVIGVGATLVTSGDLLVYFDMARWEIQLRYRAGMSNWMANNGEEPILSKYKRGFFIEWRLADRHKKELFEKMDYIVDTNKSGNPKMITGDALRCALDQTSREPFRMQPYFDPGVWGGQWMKEVFGLDEKASNFAWSFDGVPEENSLRFKFGEIVVELPCMNLVLYRPNQLLGEKVHGRFGAEFPIRFDLLDTMGGAIYHYRYIHLQSIFRKVLECIIHKMKVTTS